MNKKSLALILGVGFLLVATACGGGAKKRTDVTDVDGVIDAVTSREATAISDRLQFSTLPCTTATGEGGPPKCAAGEADGTKVDVFETYDCAVNWRRRTDVDAMVRQVSALAPRVYAAFRTPPAYEPGGQFRDAAAVAASQYIAVFDTDVTTDQRRGIAVAVGSGKIAAIWFGCGAGTGPDAFVPAGQADFLLKPPSYAPGRAAP